MKIKLSTLRQIVQEELNESSFHFANYEQVEEAATAAAQKAVQVMGITGTHGMEDASEIYMDLYDHIKKYLMGYVRDTNKEG